MREKREREGEQQENLAGAKEIAWLTVPESRRRVGRRGSTICDKVLISKYWLFLSLSLLLLAQCRPFSRERRAMTDSSYMSG